MELNIKNHYLFLLVLTTFFGRNACVEVHFESADSGFFLKHSRTHPVTPEILNGQQTPASTYSGLSTTTDSVLSVDRFTVVRTTEPVSIRASYGPFSTKQTIPARFIVPDALEEQSDFMNNTTAALMELQQSNTHLDISAHLVQSSIPQDSPVLRVLFHASSDPGVHLQRQKICILLHAVVNNHSPLRGHCIPEGEDGVCVAEVVIPYNWWPGLFSWQHRINGTDTPIKLPQRFVQVSYSVFEPPFRNPEQCEPKVQIQPLSVIGQVPLVPATMPFREIKADDSLSVWLPQPALYPFAKLHVPVVLNDIAAKNIIEITMRARVRSGIKILGATSSSPLWNISIEKENSKHTTARVTVIRNSLDFESNENSKESLKSYEDQSREVFSWLLELLDDGKEKIDDRKIVWSVYHKSKVLNTSTEAVVVDETKRRLIAKLQINKDDIRAVLPMSKKWEIMNTAVLTGRQVAQAIKVFIVSQAGKVADVTLQSSCHSDDESVIKVSSSCSSVYVDGSEIRGSSNASIIVKYGAYVGVARFIVWMPELPLEVYIPDFRLSQIKGWKVGDEAHYVHNKQMRRRKKRSIAWSQQQSNSGGRSAGNVNQMNSEKMTCKTRYQQSPVDIYARFLAVDQNSGRISYFISRRTGLRVTDLVQPLLRVADPKIATLKGRILQGKSMGRTDIQVLSPITGRVIGAKEVRVGSDKVSLSKLIVRVVSGLQLTILPDNTIDSGYIAETFVTHRLTAQYQEGLLDIDLEFSDGFRTPLRDVSVQDYFLLVESLDTEVVAFAPMLASHHPRVIAVGEGNGNLLKITLLLSEECRSRRNGLSLRQMKLSAALGSSFAPVDVNFSNVDTVTKYEPIQNDGIISRDRKGNSGDLNDIIVGIPSSRDAVRRHHHEATLQGNHNRGSLHTVDKLLGFKGIYSEMTPVEIGMYILLTAFCFAIVVFVISCFIYASKFRGVTHETSINDPLGGRDICDVKKNVLPLILSSDAHIRKESTANVHDWVWLGRSTMDRNSLAMDNGGVMHGSGALNDKRDMRMRITSNPITTHKKIPNVNKPIVSLDGEFAKPNSTYLYFGENVKDNVKTEEIEKKSGEYRPPVPPHRNIEMFNCKNQNLKLSEEAFHKEPKHSHRKNQKHQRSHKIVPNNDEAISPTIVFDKYSISSALQNSGGRKPKYKAAGQDIGSFSSDAEKVGGIHNAEKLVECSTHNNINAFQFDSIKPEKPTKSTEESGGGSSKEIDANGTQQAIKLNNNGRRLGKITRAAVVGNPTFSPDDDEKYLALDDLDMDYEQIMQYFENLKESNA